VRPRSGETARADLSLEAPVHEDGDATWLDQVEDERPAADERYGEAESGARLRSALQRVRPRIGEVGWDVIHSRLQRDPPDTLAEIGRRWGLSRERVRQIEVETKRFLQHYLEPADLAA
jgi:RNA polymerase primary sigma factor